MSRAKIHTHDHLENDGGLVSSPASPQDVSTKNAFTDDGGVDYDVLIGRALRVFNDQAALQEKENVSLLEIEMQKAKSRSFLDALDNMMELGHTMELIKAEKHKFKRTDELKLMNTMRETLSIQAEMTHSLATMAQEDVLDAMHGLKNGLVTLDSEGKPVNPKERLISMLAVFDSTIEKTKTLVATTSQLIQLERMSGNRGWGRNVGSQTLAQQIRGLDQKIKEQGLEGSGLGVGKVRKVSRAEYNRLLNEEEADIVGD